MEWSREKICELIEEFKTKEVLWDSSNMEYKNKQKKSDAWQEIAENINAEKSEVEKKVKSLIGQFQRETKKTKTKSGDGTDDTYDSKWFAFKNLMFLKDKTKPHSTREAGIEVSISKIFYYNIFLFTKLKENYLFILITYLIIVLPRDFPFSRLEKLTKFASNF